MLQLEGAPLPRRVPTMTLPTKDFYDERAQSNHRATSVTPHRDDRLYRNSHQHPGSRGVAADTETRDDKRRARFQVNAAEVQTFYRVNRYPKR